MSGSRLHGWLLVVGWIPAAILLGRLTWDLGSLGVLLAIPIWIFYLGFLALASAHAVLTLRAGVRAEPRGAGVRYSLALVIPVAFLASILDCMGLEFVGCTGMCGFLMQIWAPLVALGALLFAVTGVGGILTALSAAALLFVVPNCVCYNPINGPWIDLLGKSPACYAGSFGVTLVALGALRTGRLFLPSLALCWLATLAMLAFFVGHHFYDYPW